MLELSDNAASRRRRDNCNAAPVGDTAAPEQRRSPEGALRAAARGNLKPRRSRFQVSEKPQLALKRPRAGALVATVMHSRGSRCAAAASMLRLLLVTASMAAAAAASGASSRPLSCSYDSAHPAAAGSPGASQDGPSTNPPPYLA